MRRTAYVEDVEATAADRTTGIRVMLVGERQRGASSSEVPADAYPYELTTRALNVRRGLRAYRCERSAWRRSRAGAVYFDSLFVVL